MKVKSQTYTLPSTFTPAGGVLLDLQYNNSNVDTSDNPKTVTAHGDEVYTDGKYGEALSARSFTGTQYDSWNNTVEIEQYNVSGWIKTNSTNSVMLINDDKDVLNGRGTIAVQLSSVIVVQWDGKNAENKQAGGVLNNLTDIGKWYHISVNFDSINKEVQVFLNARDVTHLLIDGTTIEVDFDRVKPLQIAEIQHGFRQYPNSINGNIYNIKVSDYLMSAEEIKADFKKYPKI